MFVGCPEGCRYHTASAVYKSSFICFVAAKLRYVKSGLAVFSVTSGSAFAVQTSSTAVPEDLTITTPCLSGSTNPMCVSLLSSAHPGWYARHMNLVLYLDQQISPKFGGPYSNDASFILHPNPFAPGYYALEAVSFSGSYLKANGEGAQISVTSLTSTQSFYDSASFDLYAP